MKASKQNKDQNLIFEAYQKTITERAGAGKVTLKILGISADMKPKDMVDAWNRAVVSNPKLANTGVQTIKHGKQTGPQLINKMQDQISNLVVKKAAVTAQNVVTTAANTTKKAFDAITPVVNSAGVLVRPGAKLAGYTTVAGVGVVGVYKVGDKLISATNNIVDAGEVRLTSMIGDPASGDRQAAAATPSIEQQADARGLAPGSQERADFIQDAQDRIKRQEAMGGLTGMFKKYDDTTGTASYDPAKVAAGLAVGTAGAIGAKAAYDWATKDKDEDERRGRA